jgi:hypothetical protein
MDRQPEGNIGKYAGGGKRNNSREMGKGSVHVTSLQYTTRPRFESSTLRGRNSSAEGIVFRQLRSLVMFPVFSYIRDALLLVFLVQTQTCVYAVGLEP